MDPNADHEKEKIERLKRAMYSRELSPKIHERPRHTLEQPSHIVGEDWKRPEPGLKPMTVAPRAINFARTGLKWILGASVVFFIAALAFFGYYFLFGGGSSPGSPGNIDIEIAGPLQISGGEPTELQIIVTNRNRVSLRLADLVITYPSGTRSPVDLSTDLSSQRITLGDIEAGGRRQGTVSAVFAGGTKDLATVKVDLEYRLEGSSSIFVATASYNAAFNASALSVTVDGNAETVSGQQVELTVHVTSNASAPVKDVLLAADFPFGFTFASASPRPSGNSLWELGDLVPGQKRTIVIRGTLTGENSDERVFRFNAGTRKTTTETSISTSLADNSFKMRIAEAFLGLSVSVGGRTDPQAIVAPGESVTVAINWKNNLSTAITDAVIVARLSGLQIDGTQVRSSDGFYRSVDGTVIWDKTTTKGELASLAAGARGTVAFTFQVPSSVFLENIRNPSLTITVNAGGKRISEEGVPGNLQATAVQRIDVTSSLTASAQGLYYSNPFKSTGPMPPKSGVETTYAVVFSVTNTTNALKEGKIVASLPPYVRWTGIYSPDTEKITFNQSDGTITWDIGAIEAGVGLGGTLPRRAAITIGFTPSESQIGTTPPLLQNIRFTGVEASGEICGGGGGFSTTPNPSCVISRTIRDITTNIVGDPGFNSSQATVVR